MGADEEEKGRYEGKYYVIEHNKHPLEPPENRYWYKYRSLVNGSTGVCYSDRSKAVEDGETHAQHMIDLV